MSHSKSYAFSVNVVHAIVAKTDLNFAETCIQIETICTILCLALTKKDKRKAALLMEEITTRVALRISESNL